MALKVTSDVWWKNAVIYCADVETFFDANGDGCGDLVGMTERVDYLGGLGVSCLWLMPFYPSPRRDDGYDVTDFTGIDPRLGTHGDLVEFLRTARDRGIRVIADLVVNHTSDEHPWFRSARASRDSPHRDFYVWRDERPEDHARHIIFPDRQDSNWSFDEQAGQWYLHTFYEHQPDLNVDEPRVRDAIAQTIGFWLELGLSGFRVDAVPYLIESEAGMPDPHEVLRDLRAFLDRRSGEAVLLGEVNLPPDRARAFFGDDGDELHMLLDFTTNQALYLALARGEAAPLAEALARAPELPEDAQWARFVRNHDELTLDQLGEEDRALVFERFGPEPEHRLYGRGLRRRLPSMLGGNEDALRAVYSLVFSLPGAPVLFYGEEIGMGENLAIEGRMSVRSPMQWSPDPHGGFAPAGVAPGDLCRPVPDGDLGPEHVSVAAQRRDPQSLLNWFERLIRRRRECPEIGWGALRLLDAGAPSVLAHRCDWEGETIVCLHELGGQAVRVPLDVGGGEPRALALVELFTHDEVALDAGRAAVDLEPWGRRWYRVRREGRRLPP